MYFVNTNCRSEQGMICRVAAIFILAGGVLTAVLATGRETQGPSRWPEMHLQKTSRTSGLPTK